MSMNALGGAAVNGAGALTGSLVGLLWGSRLSEGFRKELLRLVGIVVLVLGVSMAVPLADPVNTLLSLVVGDWLGTQLAIQERLDDWGQALEKLLDRENFMQGFITATVIFNVGALAIVGSLQAGLTAHPTLLETKAVLDGVTGLILTSALGWGVLLAAPATFAYEGILSLAAGFLRPILTGMLLRDLTVVGGILVAGMGANFLLEKTAVRVANLLPALILTVILGWLKQHGISFV